MKIKVRFIVIYTGARSLSNANDLLDDHSDELKVRFEKDDRNALQSANFHFEVDVEVEKGQDTSAEANKELLVEASRAMLIKFGAAENEIRSESFHFQSINSLGNQAAICFDCD